MAEFSQRYDLGADILRQVDGPNYAAPLDALKDIAPDLGRLSVAFSCRDVIVRPDLGYRTKELAIGNNKLIPPYSSCVPTSGCKLNWNSYDP
jgi:hypothetical protein